MQGCFGAASAACGGQELVSTAGVCVCVTASSSTGRGFPGWCLLHNFLWVFLCCIIVHVSPSVIISKAACGDEGGRCRRASISGSLLLWRKHSAQITCSTVIHDVIVSTFPGLHRWGGKAGECITILPGDLFRHCCSSCTVQLLSYESARVGRRTLESPW